MTGSSKFYLSDYIQLFLENIGASAQTYNLLDGRQLVPYQCVVAREQWNSVRARFFEAFYKRRPTAAPMGDPPHRACTRV